MSVVMLLFAGQVLLAILSDKELAHLSVDHDHDHANQDQRKNQFG